MVTSRSNTSLVMSDTHSDVAHFYAAEIAHVFCRLKEVSPTITDRLGAQEATWVSIEKGGKETIRDYMLSLNDDSVIDCPLSHNLSNNKSTFQVDHFYPVKNFMETLRELENNQSLLRLIKGSLKLLLKKGIPDILIPESDGLLLVARLRVLYYNYIQNLWLISGYENTAKNKQCPFRYCSVRILESFGESRLSPEVIDKIKQDIFAELGLEYDNYKIKTATEQGEEIGKRLNEKFDEQCAHQHYILPYYLTENFDFVFMFDFFKQFEISKVAFRLSEHMKKHAHRSLGVSSLVAVSLLSKENNDGTRNSLHSKAVAIGAALHSVLNSAKNLIGNPDCNSPCRSIMASPLSVNTDLLKAVDIVVSDLVNFRNTAQKLYDRKRNLAEESDESRSAKRQRTVFIDGFGSQENSPPNRSPEGGEEANNYPVNNSSFFELHRIKVSDLPRRSLDL